MPDPGQNLASAVFGSHALDEIRRRALDIEQIRAVLAAPGSTEEVRPGRLVIQGLFIDAGGRQLVLRVFVDIDRQPPIVVTAYRSSKIRKYWRG